MCGVMTLVVASSPWMESLAERTFTGHMVQHLLVIAVGRAVARARRAVAHGDPLGARSRRRPPGAASARMAAPGAPWSAPWCSCVVLFVTHLTSIYDRALGNRLVHELEHVAYLRRLRPALVGRARAWAGRRRRAGRRRVRRRRRRIGARDRPALGVRTR